MVPKSNRAGGVLSLKQVRRKWAVFRYEILMARRHQGWLYWPDTAFRLDAIDGIELIKDLQQTVDVFGCPTVDYIDFKGGYRDSLQRCRKPAYDDEFHTFVV